MSERKLPNSLTDEELLKVLENEDFKTEEIKILDEALFTDIPAFVHAYDIKPGTKPIVATLLYKLYRHWSKDPLTSVIFNKHMLSYFRSKRGKHSHLLFINVSFYKLMQKLQKALSDSGNALKNKVLKNKAVFESFITLNNIKAGTEYIASSNLHSLFMHWRKVNNIKKNMDHRHFKKFLEIYFEGKKIMSKYVTSYGINQTVEQLENTINNTSKEKQHEENDKEVKKTS